MLAAADEIPYPSALDAAAVKLDRMNDLSHEMILGNGDIAAIVSSTNGADIVLELGKNDVWDARIDTSDDPDLLDLPARKAKAGPGAKWPYGFPLHAWPSWKKDCPMPNRCARVILHGSPGAAGDAACQSVLDIRRAVLSLPGSASSPKAEIRTLAQRNVVLIQSTGSCSLESSAWKQSAAGTDGETDGVKWLKRTIPGDPDWPGMQFAVAMAGAGGRTLVSIVTSFESKDVVADAVKLARSAADEDAAKVVAEHEKTWEKFWSASGVELDNSFLSNAWYRNLYFMRCCSKPGVEAVGLFVAGDVAWHGGHTLNYNAEQTFWTPYITNHVDLAEPYERLIANYLPRAEWVGMQTYGCEGAHYPHNIYPYEPTDPAKCKSKNHRTHIVAPWGYTLGLSGFAVQNLWWHYKYQPDRDYLEKVCYPVLRAAALLYVNIIDRCETGPNGRVLLGPTASPEHHGYGTHDCALDIAYFQYTFDALIEAAGILGQDAELVKRCRAALLRLPVYPVSEGPNPVVVDVGGVKPQDYNWNVPAVPVFPAGVVTWFSPEPEKGLFANTVGRQTTSFNASMMLCAARARLSLPGTVEWIQSTWEKISRPNGTLTCLAPDTNGHYTEQFAATMVVSELLLQSVGDVIRVFPAWPLDRSAKFSNLRAQGGFLVSAEQGAGRVQRVEITATVGGKLRLLNPWTHNIVEQETRPGEKLVFTAAR
jgi:hypothetical protein